MTTLKVWHCDGSVSSYTLSESSHISFRQAEMCYSDGDWSLNIPLSEIKTWTYDTSGSGIEDFSDNSAEIHISQKDNQILISGIGQKDLVRVFANEGYTVYEARNSSNPLIIDASSWVGGVYIVTIGNKTYKIIKR